MTKRNVVRGFSLVQGEIAPRRKDVVAPTHIGAWTGDGGPLDPMNQATTTGPARQRREDYVDSMGQSE